MSTFLIETGEYISDFFLDNNFLDHILADLLLVPLHVDVALECLVGHDNGSRPVCYLLAL